MPSKITDEATFDIGLVMSGACSAGAYTAGVVDFLLEALAAWESAKERGDDVPRHRVVIRAAGGTSAGGVVAALMSMLPFVGHAPITDLTEARRAADPANAQGNLLYRSWVCELDMARLLETSDLDTDCDAIHSLLNGDVLFNIAEAAVAQVRAAINAGSVTLPGYFANPLEVFLCMTNIQGVPFLLEMVSGEGLRGHRLTRHAHCAKFAVLGVGTADTLFQDPDAILVNCPETAGFDDLDGWGWLRDAALATSAFPCGLPARPFRYRFRPLGCTNEHERLQDSGLVPHAALEGQEFWCLDGGLVNNEPLEFARRALARNREARSRDLRCDDHAVILIDPFPDDEATPAEMGPQRPDLVQSLIALLPVLRAHGHFKSAELLLALKEDVRTRFLIAPHRASKNPGEGDLATGGVAGFSGFVNEQLRMHDFQLGRRNCQSFLRDRFTMRVDNPLAVGWVEQMREKGILSRYQPFGGEGANVDSVQIIPIVDKLRLELPLRPWPKLDRDRHLRPLARKIGDRAQIVVPKLVRSMLTRLGVTDRRVVGRIVRTLAANVISDRVSEAASRAIEADLEKRGML